METEQTDGQAIEAALPAAIEANDEGQAQPRDDKPAGYYPVDFETATPEEIKQRHDYLYRQIKDNKRTEKSLREFKDIAAEQAKRIDELTNGFTGVVNHLQEQSLSATETQLRAQMKASWEAGDLDGYEAAKDKLDDLKLDKKLSAKQQKPGPKTATPSPQYNEGSSLAPEDQVVVDTWQEETDESGKLLRPWAYNKSEDPENPDPEYLAALRETFSVLQNPRFKNYTMQQKMAEVDRRMGVSKMAPKQTVMGGGLTGNRKTSKITLSPEAERLAVRTKFGGPKAKSDSDHIEAYRKQIEQSKGARK